MVVENSPADRSLARLILTDAGYNVLEASDGANAVTTYLDNAELIDLVVMDLVVMDLVLPRMGGLKQPVKSQASIRM
ncbi:MAG: response regulator [Candidatus Azotimanducaceae bacterium WSBS_2022_MAG_OTU7]